VSGLLKIFSAFTLVSVPRREDPDNFFCIFLSPIDVDHDVYCGTANPPDRVPALFARFLVDPIFFQDPAFIGKDAGGERKGDAVFLLILAVLSFIPFQPHVYILGSPKQVQIAVVTGCRRCRSRARFPKSAESSTAANGRAQRLPDRTWMEIKSA
jgi:hypothetical protein